MGEGESKPGEGRVPEAWKDLSEEEYVKLGALIDESASLSLNGKKFGIGMLLQRYEQIGEDVHQLAKMPNSPLDTRELILAAKVLGFSAKSPHDIQRVTGGLSKDTKESKIKRLTHLVATKAYLVKKDRG